VALRATRLGSMPYKWLVAVAFVVGLFMDMLDTTVVNVALPALGVVFTAPNTTLEWVVTAYLLSLAVWIPASGWLGDRFGTKRIFLLALAIFTLGSACCGLAQSIESLIAFRVLQGIGGGMLTPVGMAMVYRAFPQEERARAAGVLAIPIVLAPTVGPVVGGFLVDHASWRWIFYVNFPIGILAFLFAAFVLEEHVEERPGRFDVFGFIFSAAGFPLLLYALSQAPEHGWTSIRVMAAGLGGILLLVMLVIVELRVAEPLLDFRLFGERMFRAGNLAYFVYAAGVLGVLFLLPLFLQQLRGISALQTGLVTFTQAIGLVITVRPASHLYDRIGPRRMVALGMIGTAVTTALLIFVGLHTNLWWLRGILFFRGVALALAVIPLQAATYARVSSEDTGRASALFNTNRQVSASLAIAVLATVLTTSAAHHVADGMKTATTPALQARAVADGTLLGYRDAYIVAVVIALLGLICAWLIHDEDAVGVTGHGGFD
jgi:EmrB/QacA subfamily drug resistance transporter